MSLKSRYNSERIAARLTDLDASVRVLLPNRTAPAGAMLRLLKPGRHPDFHTAAQS
jgi:hypothetical protein